MATRTLTTKSKIQPPTTTGPEEGDELADGDEGLVEDEKDDAEDVLSSLARLTATSPP